MRIAATLLLALCCACAGGRMEYAACEGSEVGQVRCGIACPAGGVGCGSMAEVAIQCTQEGRWYSVSDCERCSENSDRNTVTCGDDLTEMTARLAPCSEGEACSPDGKLALHCVDGEYRVKEACEAPRTCALEGTSSTCR